MSDQGVTEQGKDGMHYISIIYKCFVMFPDKLTIHSFIFSNYNILVSPLNFKSLIGYLLIIVDHMQKAREIETLRFLKI